MTATFQTVDQDIKGYNGQALVECLLGLGANLLPIDNALLASNTSLITLEWEEVTNAEWYVVQYSLNSDFRGSTTRGFKVVDVSQPIPSSIGVESSDVCYSTPPTSVTFDVPNDIKRGFKYYWRVYPYSKCNGACSGPPSKKFSFKVKAPNLDLDCDDDVTITPIVGSALAVKGSNGAYSIEWTAPSQFLVTTEWSLDGDGADLLNSDSNTATVKFIEDGDYTLTFCLMEQSGDVVCCKELKIQVKSDEYGDGGDPDPDPDPSDPDPSDPLDSSAPSSALSSDVIVSSLPSSGSAPSSAPCAGVDGTFKVAIIINEVDGCYVVQPCDFTYESGRLCSVTCDTSSG